MCIISKPAVIKFEDPRLALLYGFVCPNFMLMYLDTRDVREGGERPPDSSRLSKIRTSLLLEKTALYWIPHEDTALGPESLNEMEWKTCAKHAELRWNRGDIGEKVTIHLQDNSNRPERQRYVAGI